MEPIRIATAQFEHRSGDKKFNLSRIEKLAEQAAGQGARAVAFHECSITGYTFARKLSRQQMLQLAEPLPGGESIVKLQEIAGKFNISVLAGLFEKDEADKIYKAYVCVDKTGNEEKDKPVLIIGRTLMGKGALTAQGESFEGQPSTHGQPLSAAGADFRKTISNLGGDPDNPFEVFEDVRQYYNKSMDRKKADASARKKEQKKWEQENPDMALKLNSFFSGKHPDTDYSSILQKPGTATRAASGVVLAHFARTIENMIVASADLANSDKTDGFLKESKAFAKNDFSGAFLHAGVSELTMAAIANGIVLHGGVTAAIGTFFVFSDYMKPAVRLAALMELPVKYIWTHDAFRVGEDGPTHQPVEHEAQIRLMEELKNHSGLPSVMVLRPADAAETTVAWKMAMENTKTPTALILSRQNIKDIPAPEGKNRYTAALEAGKGAYIVQDDTGGTDIILIGSGSEVSTLIDGAALLRKEKSLRIRIISLLSEGLFRRQPLEYQLALIPKNIPVFGLTAGLPSGLQQIAGPRGKVFGLDHFGYSAPAGVLDEKFGFTPENVFRQVEAYLKEYKK